MHQFIFVIKRRVKFKIEFYFSKYFTKKNLIDAFENV